MIEPEDRNEGLRRKAMDYLLSTLAQGQVVHLTKDKAKELDLTCNYVDCGHYAETISGVKGTNVETGAEEWRPYFACKKHKAPTAQFEDDEDLDG